VIESAFRWVVVAAVVLLCGSPASGKSAPASRSADAEAALGDIHGVFAWTTPDATRVNLLMTVAPFASSTTFFAPGTQYVFHVSAYPAFRQEAVAATNVICQFYSSTDIECWVGNSYVRGNATSTTGLVSNNGLIKVFAGRRSDPLAFNATGFEAAMQLLREFPPSTSGPTCSPVPPPDAARIVARLAGQPLPNLAAGDDASVGQDPYAASNVLALVLQVDKRLLGVTSGAPLISVWGSTHRQ
jgi:Domain of unknown function (DUF4331)